MPELLRPLSLGEILVILALSVWMMAPAAEAERAQTAPNAAIAAYTQHLGELQSLVASCQKQRTAAACDSAQVGSNDHIPWPPGSTAREREIDYDWLRALLNDAGKPESGKDTAAQAGGASNSAAGTKPSAPSSAPSMDALLTEARQRLAADAQRVAQPAAAVGDYSAQRRALTAILAQRAYQGVAQTTMREHFLEWFGNVLNAILGSLMRFGARSPWIGFVLRALLLGGACLLLVWFLIRLERRSRIRLMADGPGFSNAPSTRNWQLWLRDAQAMAAQGLWREGIHFLYWAAIARLESHQSWAADRARTPREYLLLLPASDPRRAGLTALTRTFERTWYGGREAGSADYQSAMRVAAELGVE